ncbi:hypothetical protein IFR04_010922 [Cadophora malorum]|uniref:2EXR domain-containing protein n=1 Tax=Cadophora malorum TaxID=108018 RepID=A0A8H7TA83_9HELO|nr:hypothetical protein IFR04_010922 [Cadophora malorum]
MSPSSTPPTPTFHLFPNLPLELRNQIWTLSLPPPRLIPLQTEKGTIHISGRHPNIPFLHVWCTTRRPVPSLLHTCRESRIIGLKHYSLLFDTNCRPAKEDVPELHNLPTQRGGRELIFPFERKRMMYVDLERDFIVTSHRRMGFRRPPNGWPKDETADPRFAAWPVQQGPFKIEILREVVPEEVYMRIRNFAATFTLTLNELFLNRRYGMGMVSRRRVLVVRDPFVRTESGGFYVDEIDDFHFGGPTSRERLRRKGRVRSLVDVGELQRVVDEGTVWDWAVDQRSDERGLKELNGVDRQSEEGS